MSKRPRKSRHRIPSQAFAYKEPVISERYQAEIDRSVSSLTRKYRRAEEALEKALLKKERLEREWAVVEKAERDPVVKDRVWRNFLAVIEEYDRANDEYWGYHSMMDPSNVASAKHRGRKSFKKV